MFFKIGRQEKIPTLNSDYTAVYRAQHIWVLLQKNWNTRN